MLYKELQFRQIYAKHKVLECAVVGRDGGGGGRRGEVEGEREREGERDEEEGRAKRG